MRYRGGERYGIWLWVCSTASSQRSRSFLTKEERIQLLKEYKNDLEKETQGVAEKIKELEVA